MNDALVVSSLMDSVGDGDSEDVDDDDDVVVVVVVVTCDVDEFISSVANCMRANAPSHFRFFPVSMPTTGASKLADIDDMLVPSFGIVANVYTLGDAPDSVDSSSVDDGCDCRC